MRVRAPSATPPLLVGFTPQEVPILRGSKTEPEKGLPRSRPADWPGLAVIRVPEHDGVTPVMRCRSRAVPRSDPNQQLTLHPNLLSGFVLGHFRLYDELARGAAADGLDVIGRQQRYADTIRMVIEPTRFPRTVAAFTAVAELAAADTVREDFEFGLARLLDGIEAMLLRPDGVPPPSSHAQGTRRKPRG